MNENNYNSVVPQLRFPEFTGEWKEKKLGDCLDYEQPQEYLVESDKYVSNGIPVLTAGKTFILGYTKEKEGVFNNLPVIIFDDFTTASKFVDFPFKAKSSAMKMLLPKKDVNLRFVYESMQLIKYQADDHKRHWISFYSNIPVYLPPSPSEQQKIADCLSSLDDMISAQAQKTEALREYKRGLMQQLFPANGATTPQLRFPEFTGEWKEKKLGDSFDERVEKNRGDLPLLSLSEEGLKLQSETERKDNSNADKSKYLRVALGDIAYNTMRMWQGRCVYSNIEGIVSPAYTVCKPKQGIDGLFHYYLFKTNRMIHIFHQNSQGLVSDTLNLKYDSFSKIKYFLPPTPSEQQKIADCLSSLDDMITAQAGRTEALREYKRGLMQQLFPQPSK